MYQTRNDLALKKELCSFFNAAYGTVAKSLPAELYCHEFIIVLTRILEEGFIRHKNLYEYMKNKKTNFKQNLNAVCDKVIRMILYSPGCENSILGIFVVLFNYAYTVVENRKKKVLRTFFNAPASPERNYPRVRIIPPSTITTRVARRGMEIA